MNFRDNIREDVWQRMHATKFILGRKRIDRLVDKAVAQWPTHVFLNSETADEQRLFADAFAHRIAREEFGSVMIILFIGLITALVQVLLEWWLLKQSYRIEFTFWRQDLTR